MSPKRIDQTVFWPKIVHLFSAIIQRTPFDETTHTANIHFGHTFGQQKLVELGTYQNIDTLPTQMYESIR